MLRMFRELKGSYRYIVLIFALLFGQAFCDLALPSYTSDIINVGVQQGGIPDSVPDQIREESPYCLIRADPWCRWCAESAEHRRIHDLDPWNRSGSDTDPGSRSFLDCDAEI